LTDQKTAEVLGEEENMADSMNLTLSEQLFRLRDYFPDKLKPHLYIKEQVFQGSGGRPASDHQGVASTPCG